MRVGDRIKKQVNLCLRVRTSQSSEIKRKVSTKLLEKYGMRVSAAAKKAMKSSARKQSQYKIGKMNTLQCEVCQHQISVETATQPEASLLKASEAVEMLHPVHVYCVDCKQYLCRPCDYKAHLLHDSRSGKEDASESFEKSNLQNASSPRSISLGSASKIKLSSSTQKGQHVKFDNSNSKSSAPSGHDRKDQQTDSEAEGKSTTTQYVPKSMIINHERVQICEECAEEKSQFLCPKCEQALCQPCWSKIHNKGARKRHQQKSLKTPKFYPPHLWLKTSLAIQPSSGSSISQIKHEHEFEQMAEVHVYDEKERSSLLGGLQVQLQSCLGPQGTAQEHSHRANGEGEAAMHQQHVQGQSFNMQSTAQYKYKPPLYRMMPEYGQSPSYVQQHPQHMNAGQVPINSATFHPQMSFNGSQPPSTFHQPHHYGFGPPPGSHFYVYPDPQGHFVGYNPYDSNQMQNPGQGQVNWPTQMGQNHGFQPQQQQQQPFDQRRVPPEMQNWALGRLPSKRSQLSEDDLSTGIHEEAKHQLPNALMELHRPRKHAQSGNDSSNLNFAEEGGSDDDTAFQTNLNLPNPRLQQALSQGGSSLMNDPRSQGGVFKDPLTSKSFTPLRRGQQSSKDYLTSPLMSTPNEQQRVDSIKNSKLLMTPPVVLGAQNHNSGFKIKSNGNTNQSALHIGKASRPLKVPRSHVNGNASHSLYMGGGGNKTSSDKKGPHIQYQVKAGKPNSMSSHEMNSDYSGDLPPMHPNTRMLLQQQSFDAYQLSQSAKTNNRNNEKLGGGNGRGAYNKPSPQSIEYSPEGGQSAAGRDDAGSNSNYSRLRKDDHYGASRGGQLLKGRSSQFTTSANNSSNGGGGGNNNHAGGNSYHSEKREYKLKGSGPYQGATQSSGQRQDSHGSAQKKNSSNSTSTYTSGNARKLQGRGETKIGSSRQGLETLSYQPRRDQTSQMQVPISQPAIQLEQEKRHGSMRRSGATQAGSGIFYDENKQATGQLPFAEENSLLGLIQQILFEDAALGELLILKTKFVDQIILRTTLDQNKALKAIERAVNYGIIHQTDRNFANSKKIEFISLKIQVLSHQCLQWVITSLRRDEMTPTETAIKNRTKEAFNFKLQNDYWEAIMKSIQQVKPQARLSDTTQNEEQKQSVTPPDKGSNAHTTKPLAKRTSGNVDSSFTQSSAGSTMPPLTTSTVSAQGITRITVTKPAMITEADSRSTFRNQQVVTQNESTGGAATQSSGQGTDSQQAEQPGSMNQHSQHASGGGSSSQKTHINHIADASASSSLAPAQSANSAEPRFKVVLQQPAAGEEQAAGAAEGSGTSGVVGGNTHAIYMEDEEVWTGVDIDDDSTVDRMLYTVMISFLREYFCPNENTQQSDSKERSLSQAEEKKSVSLSDDLGSQSSELRMIPGGRYGCTQFLKICGPEAIQSCSVGKTTQMVQLAIKEDILRHLKTQIVWSTQVDKHKIQQDTLEDQQILVQRKAKLEKVKEAIIEILAESKTGMSLAQLPQYLKKKLPFNLEWNELGFPKLKDLLNSMEDNIKVELRDANHPFAYLVHKKRGHAHSQHQAKQCLDKSIFRGTVLSEQMDSRPIGQMIYCNEKLSQVVQAVFTLLQMEPQGIKEKDLSKRIQGQLDFDFNLQALGCNSEYEFVKNFIMPKDDSIEFFTTRENGKKTYILRSKKIFSAFFDQMVKQNQLLIMGQQEQMTDANGAPKIQHNAGYFPSSLSHKHFNRAAQPNNYSNTVEPSDISSDYQDNDHRQRIQTQPNDLTMPRFQLQHPYFPTCESIYGDDTISESCSSLQNQVKAISCLTDDYDSQRSITIPPTTQLSPTKVQQQQQQQQMVQIPPPAPQQSHNQGPWQQQMMPASRQQQQHQCYPWYPPPQHHIQAQHPPQHIAMSDTNGAQFEGSHQQGFSNQIFDNLKIDPNFQNSGMTQALHNDPRSMMNVFSMPIDNPADEQVKASHEKHGQAFQQQNQQQRPQKPQNAPPHLYQIFQRYDYGDNDSPRRVQQQMNYLFDDSGVVEGQAKNLRGGDPSYELQINHMNNATSSDLKTQYDHFSGAILDQSIFSEPAVQARGNLSAVEQDAGHKSIGDINLEARLQEASSQKEVYCPLLPAKQIDEQVSLRSWYPKSTLSDQLEVRLTNQLQQIKQEALGLSMPGEDDHAHKP